MKRGLSLVAILLLIFFVVGCGIDSEENIQKPVEVIGDISTVPYESGITETEETITEDKSEEITINETILVDDAGVKITAKSLDVDGLFGPEIKLLIENNSGEDLTFQSRNASVNGYMVETMMSVDVTNGKKANDTLIFLDYDLKASGMRWWRL